MNGALVSFNEGLIVPQDDECILRVFLEEESAILELVAGVIYSNFTMIGVKFSPMDSVTLERLYKLVASLSRETEKLSDELKLLRRESDS